jgi:UDP-N-acetylmuramoyl-tripeptide--D-alanyl-D-alanine ligase
MPQLLSSELAQWCGGEWRGAPPDSFNGVCTNSRELVPGELFVALRGEKYDGHAFVSAGKPALVDAAYADATAVAAPLLVVPDTRKALMALARGHRQTCRARFIGVTGSVGKTSVKEMTADLLAQIGTVCRTQGNWNNDIGLPLSLLRMERDDAFGVFEVGMNHPGELAPLCDLLAPECGVLTPIGPVHLEHFDNVAGIAEEKATLVKALPENGRAILSIDDPWYAVLAASAPCRVMRVSLSSAEADYVGSWQPTPSGSVLTVTEPDRSQTHSYTLLLPGRYVAENALRAVAVAREYGVEPAAIAAALMVYTPLRSRWEVSRTAGWTVINDAYNANPVSMRAAVDAFAEWPGANSKWLVLAGMYELGPHEREEHKALGRYVAQFPWRGIVTVGAFGKWIAAGVRAAGGAAADRVIACANVDEAATQLINLGKPGDAVLLKASRSERLEQVLALLSKGVGA